MKGVLKFWLVLVVFCGILLSACTVSDIPVVPNEPVDPVTPVDPKPVVNDMMDTSVNPGDDFYRYCNGRWIDALDIKWENTDKQYYGFFPNEIEQEYGKECLTIEAASIKTISKHLDAAKDDFLKNEEFVTKAKERLQAAAVDRDQLWLTIGKMLKEGYPLPITLKLMQKKGIVGLVLVVPGTIYDLGTDAAPAVAPGSESAVGAEWPMLKKICEGFGISAEYCYLPTEVVLLNEESEPIDGVNEKEALAKWQSADPKKLADYLADMLDGRFTQCYSAPSENEKINIFEDMKIMLNYDLLKEYADKFIQPSARSLMAQLCDRLRKAYLKRLETNPWMSDATRANAIEKLQAMVFNVGLPEKWYPEAMTDMSKNTLIVEDFVEINRAKNALIDKIVGKTIAETDFNMCFFEGYTVFMVNARYQPELNAMSIYPVFLREPFISHDGLNVEMFAYSAIYAHEITHGFDSMGALFNKYGEYTSIMASEADNVEFRRRIDLLVNCFDSMETLPGNNIMCNGKMTETENIADLGGFLIAYDACKAWLEEEKGLQGEALKEQLIKFCISFGNFWRAKYTDTYIMGLRDIDRHSFNRDRVNGAVRNTDAWYELFGVKDGNALYLAPDKRAYIW